MTFKTINLWPTPVYIEDIGMPEKDILKFCQSCEYDIDITKDKYILNKLPKLKNEIYNSCLKFIREVIRIKDTVEFYFLNSWILKLGSEGISDIHHHANSLISGVYYIDVPEKEGDIVFNKNSIHINTFFSNISFDYEEANEINCLTYKTKTKNGLLILFPSHLTHHTTKTFSDNYRYSLAFNMFCKGTLNQNGLHILELK
jgi:uncharacterized protein (TIGR02466 family)